MNAGTASARLNYILDELAKRFPEAHSEFHSDPKEPKYFAAIDALLKRDPLGYISPDTHAVLTKQGAVMGVIVRHPSDKHTVPIYK